MAVTYTRKTEEAAIKSKEKLEQIYNKVTITKANGRWVVTAQGRKW